MPATSILPTLGGFIDGETGHIRPTQSRLWNLILTFRWLACGGKTSADYIQRVLGQAMALGEEHGLDEAGDLGKLTMDRNRKGFLPTSRGCVRREQQWVPGVKRRVDLRDKELEPI